MAKSLEYNVVLCQSYAGQKITKERALNNLCNKEAIKRLPARGTPDRAIPGVHLWRGPSLEQETGNKEHKSLGPNSSTFTSDEAISHHKIQLGG